MRILLIDDDGQLLRELATLLTNAGHVVIAHERAVVGFEAALHEAFDIVITDVNMPELDGLTLCKRLRERGSQVPLLMLTSRDSELDEALGLELGADDYISKPFRPRSLLARIDAVARRAMPSPATTQRCIKHGRLRICLDEYSVDVDGLVVPTTATEFRILGTLAQSPGRVFTRDRLMELARADETIVTPRIIDTYIARLRKKLGALDSAIALQIETVAGVGYRWRRM